MVQVILAIVLRCKTWKICRVSIDTLYQQAQLRPIDLLGGVIIQIVVE